MISLLTKRVKSLVEIKMRSSGSDLSLLDSCKLRLPLISVFNKLLLIVKKLLVEECCVLKVRALIESYKYFRVIYFNDCINGASFLAESAENALS